MAHKLRHVMIDLETFDTIPSSKIISIGAVTFDPRYSSLGAEFYTELDYTAQVGRTESKDTVEWWCKQTKEAKRALEGMEDLEDQLKELALWLPDDCKVWGNGATFDISMLEDAYRMYRIPIPWKFWNVRDVRTIKDIYESGRGGFGKSNRGVRHNALDDARNQAKDVCKWWHEILNGNK